MGLELDHVFIFVSEGAPEADALSKFGFSEGEPNVHPGQGTSNRRFFFSNMMLELLWVSNVDEVKSALTKPTMFWERWSGRNNNRSPFGIVLRSSSAELPFDGWEYKPNYLPEGVSFLVGNNAEILNEPIFFRMPFGKMPGSKKKTQPFQNNSGFTKVTSLCVKMPQTSPESPIIKTLGDVDTISFKESDSHVMEVGFDGEHRGKSKDFRPELPLIVKW